MIATKPCPKYKVPHFLPIWLVAILILLTVTIPGQCDAAGSRQTIMLDGTWQVEEGNMTNIPTAFAHTVPVPGLVSLAQPPFVEPGPIVMNRNQISSQKDPRRDAFWYRRTFTVEGPVPPVAMLKVNKAMFGTRVFLNGQLLGDHLPCFTPGYFDTRAALKTGENEIIIRVGADRDAVGLAVPSGFDFEKERYIPGIFDSVELILSGTPNIVNVQVIPDITKSQAGIRLWLKNTTNGEVWVEVREAKSGKLVGTVSAKMIAAPDRVLDLAVPISDCHLWSPEDPFLYTLTARTSGDEFTTRFGMREFHFDSTTGCAVLNGRPYFMRGSNFNLYRFFEDSKCGELPWNDTWVRLLHHRVKNMHWNCLRYCIGFPPEAWYRIADEEGILIQDEFPIWFGYHFPDQLKSDELATEYADWMRERWNHPSVVIWDASNETISKQTAPAIQQVRNLDLSGRPWDNSYTAAQQPGDTFESHPYHFQNPDFKLSMLATANPVPQGNALPNDRKHAVIINEYGWLWLNRDGSPTTLTHQLYQNLLGPNSTTEQRRHLYALYTADETEFWRVHRNAAAVMQFNTLSYSRPNGQTSDNWQDVATLQWEPEFYRRVRDAFAPVGLMIDLWKETEPTGTTAHVPVVLIDDQDEAWNGTVTLEVKSGDQVLMETKQDASVAALGTKRIVFDFTWPQIGPCVLEAVLHGADGESVHSDRELTIEPPKLPGLATASSVQGPTYAPSMAVDGNEETYWSSTYQDNAWLDVDLGTECQINRVNLVWEAAYAKSFTVEVSLDSQTWTQVYKSEDGRGGSSDINFSPIKARHVRVVCSKRGTLWGNAIRELEVFPSASN